MRDSERSEAIPAARNHLLAVDPDVAVAGEDVDVGARLPRGAGLAAVRIAEREVDAGELLVLQQNADHPLERQIGAERQLADTIAVLVGVRVLPELPFEVAARAGSLAQAAV